MSELLQEALAESMTIVPLALIIVAVILRQIPRLTTWMIIITLWVIGIGVGIYIEHPEISIVHGFLQGTIASGLALVFVKFIKEPTKD